MGSRASTSNDEKYRWGRVIRLMGFVNEEGEGSEPNAVATRSS